MNLKWLSIPIVIAIALAILFASFPTTTAYAGFVGNEEPVNSTVFYAQSEGKGAFIYGGGSTRGTTYERKSIFPMSGNWIIQPGRAFKLQFFVDKNACVCIDKHTCMNYEGEWCY